MAKSLMRTEIGKFTLDEALHNRRELNKNLLSEMKNISSRWGMNVKRYEIKTIFIDDEFTKVMAL